MTGPPVIEDGHILVPDRPGLGVDLDEEAIERYPPHGNAIPVEEEPDYDYQYVAAHRRRAAWLILPSSFRHYRPTENVTGVPRTVIRNTGGPFLNPNCPPTANANRRERPPQPSISSP